MVKGHLIYPAPYIPHYTGHIRHMVNNKYHYKGTVLPLIFVALKPEMAEKTLVTKLGLLIHNVDEAQVELKIGSRLQLFILNLS